MGWLEDRKRVQAAKRYASLLPRRLSEAYGHSKSYTEGQIRTAVAFLKLDPDYIAFAFAAFQTLEDYELLRPNLGFAPAYEEAQAEFERRLPSGRHAWTPQEQMSSYIVGGGR